MPRPACGGHRMLCNLAFGQHSFDLWARSIDRYIRNFWHLDRRGRYDSRFGSTEPAGRYHPSKGNHTAQYGDERRPFHRSRPSSVARRQMRNVLLESRALNRERPQRSIARHPYSILRTGNRGRLVKNLLVGCQDVRWDHRRIGAGFRPMEIGHLGGVKTCHCEQTFEIGFGSMSTTGFADRLAAASSLVPFAFSYTTPFC